MKIDQNVLLTKSIIVLSGICAGALCASAEMATIRLASVGGQAAAAPTQSGKKTCYAVKVEKAPVLDGKLDDDAWKKAPPVTLAMTLDGRDKAQVPAEARVCRDDKNLYIAVKCTEPLMAKLKGVTRGNDGPIWEDDSVEIFIGVGGTYYHIGVNALGSTYDGKEKDGSWNSGVKAASSSDKDSWTVEIAIPIAAMAGDGPVPEAWTVNFCRNRQTTGNLQEFAWSPTFEGSSHVPERFGDMLLKDPPQEQPKSAQQPGGKANQLEVREAAGGLCVLLFDLSGIPKGAKIYRADLYISRAKDVDGMMDEANIETAVYPLFAEAAANTEPKLSGSPLAIRGPWFDCLDATKAVADWADGKPNGGFFVKSCAFLVPGRCTLEIAFEGKPEKTPPQASDLKCIHRAGQTFITWKEVSDPVGADEITWSALQKMLESMDRKHPYRYVVYRHAKPITAKNLSDAERIASVEPASCWNVNARNNEQQIDEFVTGYYLNHGQWNPFGDSDRIKKFRNDYKVGRFVIEDGGKPLPRSAGLYVHTADTKGKFYYAVATSADGVQNTTDFSKENSLADAVEEAPADPAPVLQGELPPRPYWNYPEKRLHYVQWVGQSMGNLPSQNYSWSVGVPDKLEKDAPLELSLHRDGQSYWRTQYRVERNSVVLSPYDFPVSTWWYGYHEAMGTLKSFKQGVVRNYTERRVLAFIEWACKKWPVDRNRIMVTAMRGNGLSGGLHLAIRHPEIFNLAVVGSGNPDYKAMIQVDFSDKQGQTPQVERVWGRVAWDAKADTGKSVWDELNLTRLVKELPATTELPMIATAGGKNYSASIKDFFLAMLEKGQPLMADFNEWGARPMIVTQSGNWTGTINLDVRKNISLPAFRGTESAALQKEARNYGTPLGTAFRWDTKDLVDEAGRYQITLRSEGRAITGDVTLRRLQNFKVKAGKAYAWEYSAPKVVERNKPAVPQKGEVTVGENGMLTIPDLYIAPAPGRLTVQAK